MSSVSKSISKKNKGNPSVLDALGIKIRPKTGSKGFSVVAADRRVEYVNDIRARNEVRPTLLKALPGSQKLIPADLHRAARQSIQIDLDFIVSQHPEFVNTPSNANEDVFGTGGTSLHFAVAGNNPEVIRFLVSNGANTNAASDRGITPLHLACIRGFTECAMALMDNGGQMSAKDNYGNTPYSILKSVCAEPSLSKARSEMLRYYNGNRGLSSSNQAALLVTSKMLQLTDSLLYKKY
jgi:hypothetical protein